MQSFSRFPYERHSAFLYLIPFSMFSSVGTIITLTDEDKFEDKQIWKSEKFSNRIFVGNELKINSLL